jgi:hypothetical protein
MAKQKQRRQSAADREHRRSDIGPDPAHIIENLVIAMSTAASSPDVIKDSQMSNADHHLGESTALSRSTVT